ncbi:MAG: hypothetical protein KZQ78_18280 [Candidatus Thiodiazotropha sp. (ex Ustalcina ferruginea)]|nr:hypothetical protein [Candidatus Thiodiazotropha sp. (ex Ustalcina ferruginea)]
MKRMILGLSGLLVSGPVLAHVGEHTHTEWASVVTHLLSEHGYLLLLLAAVLVGLAFRRRFRA